MLINARLRQDPTLAMINRMLSGSDSMGEIKADGIYLCNHFNLHSYIARVKRTDNFDLDYPKVSDDYEYGCYGVCDSVEQLLEAIPMLQTSDRKFCVSFTEVRREDQSPTGGWRWHKWGDYIGTYDPQCEYLYDEEGIDAVFCYHIYELAEGEYIAPAPILRIVHGET